MYGSIAPIIKNIKCHFTVNLESKNIISHLNPQSNLKLCGNLYVLRNKFIYIIFPKSNYVNVTGIKNYTDLPLATEHFCDISSLPYSCLSSIIIDNTTYSGSLSTKLNLRKIYIKLRGENLKVRFNPSFFPGLFLKLSSVGRIIVFSSGKFNIIGSKCQADMLHHFQLLIACMQTL